MKAIFLKHPEIVLILCATAFMTIIVLCAMWSIGNLTDQAERSFSGDGIQAPMQSFDLRGAGALDLRGLKPTTQ